MEDNLVARLQRAMERTVITVVLSYDRRLGVNVIISPALRTSRFLLPFALMFKITSLL